MRKTIEVNESDRTETGLWARRRTAYCMTNREAAALALRAEAALNFERSGEAERYEERAALERRQRLALEAATAVRSRLRRICRRAFQIGEADDAVLAVSEQELPKETADLEQWVEQTALLCHAAEQALAVAEKEYHRQLSLAREEGERRRQAFLAEMRDEVDRVMRMIREGHELPPLELEQAMGCCDELWLEETDQARQSHANRCLKEIRNALDLARVQEKGFFRLVERADDWWAVEFHQSGLQKNKTRSRRGHRRGFDSDRRRFWRRAKRQLAA